MPPYMVALPVNFFVLQKILAEMIGHVSPWARAGAIVLPEPRCLDEVTDPQSTSILPVRTNFRSAL